MPRPPRAGRQQEPILHNRRYSKEELTVELRRLGKQLGREVRSSDLPSLVYKEILRHYGTLGVARKHAGMRESTRGPRRWTEKAVLAEVRRLHKVGIRITVAELHRAGLQGLAGVIVHRYRGMAAVRRRAGVPDPGRKHSEPESWDAERVTEEILARHRGGQALASSKAPKKLVHAGIRYYDSWRQAVEAAGLDYDQVRLKRPPYTKSELLEMLRRVACKHPRMTVAEFGSSHLWSQRLRELWGTVENAAVAAGYPGWPRRVVRALPSRGFTLRWIRQEAQRGRTRWTDVSKRFREAVRRHFRTWPEALAAAGVLADVVRKRPGLRSLPWTRSSLLGMLRFRRTKGLPITRDALLAEYPGLALAVRRLFGITLAQLTYRYGAKPRQQSWSRERVVAALRQLARTGPVTQPRAGNALALACCRYFGTFAQARAAAGLAAPPRWTREQALAELAKLDHLGQRVPRRLDAACRRLFGTLTAARAVVARENAGRKPGALASRTAKTQD
jgi:hypothetical protein